MGEFRELGFALRFRTPEPRPAFDADAFRDAFIDAVEARGLAVAGGTGPLYDVVVMGFHESRRTVTPEQRAGLLEWLSDRPEVSEVHAGPLTDLWYGSFDDDAPAA